ncbi:MAG: pseudouridine synthase [bacterium]
MAEVGIASRRKIKDMVLAGRIKVNGIIPESPGIKIDLNSDIIEVDNERISFNTNEEKVYIILNKLSGYISAVSDKRGEPTIMNLIPDIGKRIYPVGRLDKDTEGLILLTNDGELTYLLTHPKHHIEKVYSVWVTGEPTDESLKRIRTGVLIDNEMTAPAIVEKVEYKNGISHLKVTIHEGRKRQIKKMFATIGHKVVRLKRIQIGPISIGNLKPGEYRYLTKEEINKLKNLIKIDRKNNK